VLGSLGRAGETVKAQESAQFTLPLLSGRSAGDPRQEQDFTLNQFNMVIDADDDGLNVSQIHFYTYNPAFEPALPAVLRRPSLARPLGQLLARLTVAIGYLPSWRSPSLELRATPAGAGDDLPQLTIRRNDVAWGRDPMLRAILWRLTRAGRRLDLWPILPGLMVAIGAKSYHVGSTFPHSDRGRGWPSSDRLGRVGPWDRIHLVDAAVFPNVPATTFTLTVMANAHRIATETAAATLATAADDR
jgi:hypothetical protein